MRINSSFTGWESLTLQDLLVAYRKAKADCFYENTFPSAIKFAEYEQNLLENLKSLLSELTSKKGFSNNAALLGEFRLLPKKLGVEPKENKPTSNGHIHFSDPKRSFDHLVECKKLIPEFRVVGDFPVNMHIISALWINLIGHKFDSRLSVSCYGARLKRIKSDEELDKEAEKPFHITAIGSFTPYFEPYKKWRNDGLAAIRSEIEQERDVIAVSLDLKSYYHLIDPSFLSSNEFITYIGLGDQLSVEEKNFTNQLTKFMSKWSKVAQEHTKTLTSSKNTSVNGGLTIGLTASRIISNVLLYKWDKLIKERLTPIHYGRYVDDMIIVLRDSGTINNIDDLLKFMRERLGKLGNNVCLDRAKSADSTWQINLNKGYQKESLIQLQSDKQKLFILNKDAGKDLLDSIEREIHDLSSEYRLMPSPDQLENSTAASVLSASSTAGERADTFRRADGLSIRRLSWSLQLSHVENLAKDLPSNVWKKERADFYKFAHNHIIRADYIFDHYTYLPKLLGFAVSMEEWEEAAKIVNSSFSAIEKLKETIQLENNAHVCLNGKKISHVDEKVWAEVISSLTLSFIDASARNYTPALMKGDRKPNKVSKLASLFLEKLQARSEDINTPKNLYNIAPLLASADLAKTPYKYFVTKDTLPIVKEQFSDENDRYLLSEMEKTGVLDSNSLRDFTRALRASQKLVLEKSEFLSGVFRPYLFPTRPYTPVEIAEIDPKCVGLGDLEGQKPSVLWAKYVQALRGVWVKPILLNPENKIPSDAGNRQQNEAEKNVSGHPKCVVGNKKKTTITVALTNIMTSDEEWSESACNKPRLTLERYKRISDVVNSAIKLKPKPDYLLLPELSIPNKWISSIANRLSQSGISMIAGAEYNHLRDNQVLNRACLQLTDNRLGFPSAVRIWQNKNLPAPSEEKELLSKHGKKWSIETSKRPIYIHNDFHFSLMVCSELQNSKERVSLQGKVDSLMVLSWNSDLDTFSSLIESAALDIHSYTILVNNRKYGDSRVRAPRKKSYQRDLARLRGGQNDYCVAVTFDIGELRSFQTRATRWPDVSDPFKPTPEGYVSSSSRKRFPAK
ncbi:RNA-directed DNA polymerase [Vibrio rotiferianus]|uniref:RNA-directed DNA polymerase n=1 Tax=Vibrio rotiferianus TaxID=190895 RepID=A0A7Y3Z9G2_9VIBR|nr:RNA-directed DNA polymerase [Vibrio rotiferianus]NOH48976.1 RNA-directed DNA polymerase [Vibrio rotiferianus]